MRETPNEWADFWRYEVGVNVIPADSRRKKTLVQWTNDPRGNWQTVPIPQKIHDEWKKNNSFKDGMAVICGQVFHNASKQGLWFNGIDCDNRLGLVVMCPNGIVKEAEFTIVEQHADKNKCHIYFYTNHPLKSKPANRTKNDLIPQFEIKSGGKHLMFCAGGVHKDKSPIKIIGTDKVKTVDKEGLETRIDKICKQYDIPYLSGKEPNALAPIDEITSESYELHEGENRSLAILRYLDSKKIRNPEFDELALFNLGMVYNQKHCKPPYDESKVKEITTQSFEFAEKMISENEEQKNNKESATIKSYKVGKSLIEKCVKSENNSEQIVVKVNVAGKPCWVDVLSPTYSRLVRLGVQQRHHQIYAQSTFETGIKNIHAEALINESEIRPIFTRCALLEGILYYDLQNDTGTKYRISKEGVTDVQNNDGMPIFLSRSNFHTKTCMQPIPIFENPDALDDLVKLCRIQPNDVIVFKSHLITFFLTEIPIPIALFHGEQGSAKTSVSGGIKSTIDPEDECAMSLPEKIDDLATVLSRHYVSNFDNMDSFSKEISQFLCRAITGTQYSKRQLYSDAEEFSLILKSKIILNGISPTIDQPDLIERSIFYELSVIDKTERMTDQKFQQKIKDLKPFVLGIIFKTIQKAMKIYDEVEKELDGSLLPRMASFAVWSEAISRALGHEKNAFLKRYFEKLDSSSIGLSEEYPIIEPLIQWMGVAKEEEIPITKLFDKIVGAEKKDDRWPTDPRQFGKQLRQIAPTMRRLGFELNTDKYNVRDGKYPRGSTLVKITKIVEHGVDTFAN